MSKIDELIAAYNAAYHSRHDEQHRAGIAAVVRALRDEYTAPVKGCETVHTSMSRYDFNEILGDCGMNPEDFQVVFGDAATDPAPVNVAKMQKALLRKWRKAHSNPAPAVCEWEGGGNAWLSTCGTVWDILFKDYSFGCCPSCGKPIAFKEA